MRCVASSLTCVKRKPLRRLAATERDESAPPLRVTVVGAGFSGVAVVYELLTQSKRRLAIRLLDAKGVVGGGASGVAAGLLHPFASRGQAELWRGAEGVAATWRLVDAAEKALSRPVATRCGSLHALSDARAAANVGLAAASARLSASEAAALVPGLRLPPDRPAVVFYSSSASIHAVDYLAGLWAACEAEAASRGHALSLENNRVASAAALRELGGHDAAVLATGAATQCLPELQNVALLLTAGVVVSLPNASTAASHAPAVMTPDVYVAPQAAGVALGATRERNALPASAFSAARGLDTSHPRVAASSAALLSAAAALVPSLGAHNSGAGDAANVKSTASLIGATAAWGVRATPPRTKVGALPYAARLGVHIHPCGWVLTGLGSRGLVYHALLAKEVAADLLMHARDDFSKEGAASASDPDGAGRVRGGAHHAGGGLPAECALRWRG